MTFGSALFMKQREVEGVCPLATAGDTEIFSIPYTQILGYTITTYNKYADIKLNYGGTFRVTHSIHTQSGATDRYVYTQIWKNGVPYGTENIYYTTSASVTINYSEDLNFSNGDNVQLYAKTIGGLNHCVGNLKIKANVSCTGGAIKIHGPSSDSCPY